MTDLPFEIDFALDDWQAGDGNAAFNPIPAKLNLRHDRLDLTFDDGRAVWIEQQDGTIRIHGYLSAETGHDGPVNLDIEQTRFTVGTDDTNLLVVSSQPDTPGSVPAAEGTSKPHTQNIRSFLDLSTGHLREETTKWLSRDPGTFESETGYLVWVPGEHSDCARYPRELHIILSWARGVADYVMFDRDAPTDDRFAIFDW